MIVTARRANGRIRTGREPKAGEVRTNGKGRRDGGKHGGESRNESRL
jgi:hypothetical protein